MLGRFPRVLTKAEILAIAGGPGVTMYRLLTDPADGRCIERSISAYTPDAAMRAQIRAADLTSRFPGSMVPVRDSDLDHVTPFGQGGATTEANLQGLERPGHVLKTRDFWTAVMDQTRNVTWTSFFGRTYTTRAHDYRAYLSTRCTLRPTETDPPLVGDDHHDDDGDGGGAAPVQVPWRARPMTAQQREQLEVDERYLASILTYAALSARQAGAPLEGYDDDPSADEDLVDDTYQAIWVRHRKGGSGPRVTGPRPGTPTPQQIITTDPATILAAEHWTDPFTTTDHNADHNADDDPGHDADDDPDPIPF